MSGLRPIVDLMREVWLRHLQRHLCPFAPADMHMRLMLELADIERRT